MKKVIPRLLVICCLCVCLIPTASALISQTYSSEYFRGCSANSDSSSSGKLNIAYQIVTTRTMSQAGIQKIRVYTSSGSLVQTITGTTDNGLLKTNTRSVLGTYTISNLTSGQSYYAVVELYAADANGSETQTVTTTTVTVQ